jgi:8-oxo-dGTP pyrophosphatase MutT (NUDIX family)
MVQPEVFPDPLPDGSWGRAVAGLSLDELRRRCARLGPSRRWTLHHDIAAPRHAATFVPIVDVDGDLAVVVTRRPSSMRYHRDDWVFPGGRVDETTGESLPDAAIREAHEELGVARHDLELLGRLDSFGPVITGFVIHAFVGVVRPGVEPTPDPREVAEIRLVSLVELTNPARWRRGTAGGNVEPGPLAGRAAPTGPDGPGRKDWRFFDLGDGHELWGTQADIVCCLLQHLVRCQTLVRTFGQVSDTKPLS